MYKQTNKNRSYIIYILFFFLSGSVFLADLFSNKKFSDIISDNADFLFPINQKTINLINSLDINIFESKNDLVNENARLKKEVIELRNLKLVNEKLMEDLESNNKVIKNVYLENLSLYKSSILLKNTEDQFLISGGRNVNLKKNDLILNEEGFVIGYIVKVFDDHSLISAINNNNFSIPWIDKFCNEYLITSNTKELLVNSISVEEINLDIDYISTDLTFDHLGKFPIVSVSNVDISTSNNKISAIVEIKYKFNFDSNIYIVKEKWII